MSLNQNGNQLLFLFSSINKAKEIQKMIQKLSAEVINKIAAGEVVQRPYNALKQLIQNSIDAGATIIHVRIQAGGMKKLQIRDNGRGICVQDYPLLCQRYATSKIRNVTDLQSIQSFGFRGQALASLTHVGDVEVHSRHQKSKQGYYAKFDRQRLFGEPKVMKRETGTTINVQNLFQTLSSRRKSLTPNQQKKIIKQLIFQMALDYPHIQFTLTTQKGEQMLIDYKNYEEDEARMKIFCQLTGILKQNCVLARHQFQNTKVLGIFSKINTWDKWRNMIVAINHRIVDSVQVQKIIQKAYDQANRTIHKQNYSYCCYVNIRVDPDKIDCNVHPTKKQVTFYKSADLFFQILKWMEGLLQDSGTIKFLQKNFTMSQQSLSQLQLRFQSKVLFNPNNEKPAVIPDSQSSKNSNFEKVQYAFNKTRTDAKQLPLQYFYKNLIAQNSYSTSQKMQDEQSNDKKFLYDKFVDIYKQMNKTTQILQIKNFFLSVTYVGCFNSSFIFIQVGNKLFCLEIYHFIKVYVRQILKERRLLYLFKLKQQQPLSISDLLARFLSKHLSVIGKQKLERIYRVSLQQLNLNRDYLQQKYGIKVNQFLELVSYPIVDKMFQKQILRQDSLAYLLIHIFASGQLEQKQDLNKLFMQFLASPFYPIEQSKYQLSPHTDKYDGFFSNEFIPTLKLKGKYYFEQFNGLDISNLISEMMDLKDAYKMFERC